MFLLCCILSGFDVSFLDYRVTRDKRIQAFVFTVAEGSNGILIVF